MDLEILIQHARGEAPADLLIENARVINVLSGEVQETSVALARSRIVGLGDYPAEDRLDLEGAYLAPGFIDAHVHIESSLVPPAEYARPVVPRGTTTVITDPHEIANVLGTEGIRFMFESAKDGPLSMFVMAPSCVPATHMETAGATLHSYDLAPFKSDAWVIGLAEVMNFPGVLEADPEVLAKIQAFDGFPIDGHCPGLSGRDLAGYVAAGIGSDHESTTAEEAREKLRMGLTIFIREASNAHNLEALLPLVTADNQHRFCFCTDDRQPKDLMDQGHIDYMIRAAIERGLDPIRAIRMATWNAARYFGLADRGAITPGRRADLVAFHELDAPSPHLVFRGGRPVARDGRMLLPRLSHESHPLRSTMNIDWDQVDFSIATEGGLARVIGVIPDQLVTEHLQVTLESSTKTVSADLGRDLLKIAVIERHRASGAMGKGFVQGMGLERGALSSSIAHDHHNLVVVGADDTSMWTAARRAASLGGGMVVAEGEQVLAELPLPIGGLMNDSPVEQVRAGLDKALAAAHGLGSSLHDPFMAMSFLALEVIPSLKLTDQGLIDVDRFERVPLWVE
jgi:adenine deaminase